MKKEFTKADLKDGMIVECAYERRKLVIGNGLYGMHGCLPIKGYNENLTMDKPWDDLTIQKVYKVRKDYSLSIRGIFEKENLILIWEREKKENQPRKSYDVYFCKETEGLNVDKEISMDHKPTSKELNQLMIKFKMRSAWYIKRYIYDPCAGCFGAANNDCQTCGYGGGQNE